MDTNNKQEKGPHSKSLAVVLASTQDAITTLSANQADNLAAIRAAEAMPRKVSCTFSESDLARIAAMNESMSV